MTEPEARPAFRWKDFEDGERWKVALGVWWRIFVLSIGVWIALFILLAVLGLLFSAATS
jgi:hypothetical protein